MSRRSFCRLAAGATLLSGLPVKLFADSAPAAQGFKLNYILASSMYGNLRVEEILPEVHKAGCDTIDIWPRQHADQREQIEAMGHERFQALLEKYQVQVGIYTCYNPGLLASEPWMRTVKKLGGHMLVVGMGGPKGLKGAELKKAIQATAEKWKPALAKAEELGVKIAVENHAGGLVDSPESLLMLIEAIPSHNVGIAFAPYHLPQDTALLSRLISGLDHRLLHFYAWEHGDGSTKKLPKVQEMKQMPGYGSLDFKPLIAALARIRYRGWTSIFMHPVPRGVPILPSVGEVTAAINRSREYLDSCLAQVQARPESQPKS